MTLQGKMDSRAGFTTGFDYLRIGLSIGVLIFHTVALSSGSDAAVWTGPFRFVPAIILPMFFALSGFLVTGSLLRVPLHQFITLRLARLIPALAVEITLSALIIGALVTTLPVQQYFAEPMVYAYFLNIVGDMHYLLPHVFDSNVFPSVMNGQLWTIPFELECYASLVVLTVFRVVRQRALFAATVAVVCLLFTARVLITHSGVNLENHVPGRMMVLSFLAAVALYLYRDRVPFSNVLGVLALVLSAVLLEYAELAFLAVIPVAYATVWLGLMRPPAIPFGDLSYGVYLFHFPVEQTVMHISPGLAWWGLSLVALPVTGVCAWFSWNLVEQPILSHKKRILAFSDRVVGVFGTAIAHARSAR